MTATVSTVKTAIVKIKSLPQEIKEYYDDIQADYKRYVTLFFSLSAIPYCDFEGNVFDKNLEEKRNQILQTLFCGTDLRVSMQRAIQFVDNVATKGQTENSSSYNVFYKDFKSAGAKINKHVKQFFERCLTENFDDCYSELENNICLKEKKSNYDKQFEAMFLSVDPIFWRKASQQLKGLNKKQAEKSIKELWREIQPNFTLDDRLLGQYFREDFGITCKRPNNVNYCKQLFEMVRKTLMSVKGKYTLHVNETKEIVDLKNNLLEEITKSVPDLMSQLTSMRIFLKSNYVSIGKYFFDSYSKAIEGKDAKHNAQFFKKLVDDGSYKEIFEFCKNSNNKEKFISLESLISRLEIRKQYPAFNFDMNNYGVPFGESYIPFEISIKDGKLIASFKGFPEFEFYQSDYLGNLSVSKSNRIHQIQFQHKKKIKNQESVPYGSIIKAELKELNLLCKNGSFNLYLNYSIHHPKANKDLEFFLKSSKIKSVDGFDNHIKIAAIDLNISNPITACKAEIHKGDFSHPLHCLGYGSGNWISKPEKLVFDGQYNNTLIKITNESKKLVWAIRNYKKLKNNNIPMPKEDMQFIGATLEDSQSYIRFRINTKLKSINTDMKSARENLTKSGMKNISECIRLIETEDAFASLISSYERIHLKPNESLPQTKKFDTKRANFRKFVTRRLAYKISEYASDCNIVFVENLEFDKDNYLMKLFSCKTLLSYIEEALNKKGICMVQVEKMGTSKIDPVTGKLGFRSKKDKSRLYVRRDDEICYIDSDLSACVNVMLVGLSHSICKYKIVENKEGKRSNEFMSMIGQRLKGVNYCYSDKIISEQDHNKEYDEWKRWYNETGKAQEELGMFSRNIVEQDPIIDGKNCVAFSMLNKMISENL